MSAVVDESVSEQPLTLSGLYIDLFEPELPLKKKVVVEPNSQALLIDMSKVSDFKTPRVLAASFRESDEFIAKHEYSFVAKSPSETDGVARVLLPSRPKSVIVDGEQVFDKTDWDQASKTYLLKFENSPQGRKVSFSW